MLCVNEGDGAFVCLQRSDQSDDQNAGVSLLPACELPVSCFLSHHFLTHHLTQLLE